MERDVQPEYYAGPPLLIFGEKFRGPKHFKGPYLADSNAQMERYYIALTHDLCKRRESIIQPHDFTKAALS